MNQPPRNPNMQNTAARPAPAAAGPSLNIGDIYYTLFRHKWKILICMLAGFSAAVGIHFTAEIPAVSEARLFIRFVITNSDTIALSDEAKLKSPDKGGETIMNAEIQILTSMDLARRVAETVGPEKILGGSASAADIAAAAAVVHNGVSVQVPSKSSVIRILFENPNPEIVQPVLREVVAQYLKMHVEIHRSTGMVGDFLTQETDQLRARLAQTEEELRRATSRLGVVSLEDAKANYAAQIAALEASIYSAQAELADRTAFIDRVAEDSGKPITATEAVPPPDPGIVAAYRALVLRLDSLRQRELELLAQFAAESSRVVDVRQQIETSAQKKSQLEEQHPGLLQVAVSKPSDSGDRSINLQIESARLAGLKSRINALSAQLEQVRGRVKVLDEAEATIAQLQRRRELEEVNYRHYAASLEQSRINEALGAGRVSNISVVQQPTLPARDSSKVRKTQAIAGAAGLALGIAWAFLIELILDRSVRRASDVRKNAPFPLFITIPRIKPSKLRASPKTVEENANASLVVGDRAWADAEALHPFYDTLRDRMISFFDAKGLTHKPKLVAVTSIGAKSGTTTTATGLARSLSETGDGNVLLVDMTPGQQTAQHFRRGSAVVGLEDTLASKQDRVAIDDNLYVAGGTAEEELTRILPRQFNKLMPKLRASDFDYIIFDMPAVSQISITPRVAGFMDLTFVVVESEKTTRDSLQRAGDMLTQAGATVGVVLNKNRSYLPAKIDDEVLA